MLKQVYLKVAIDTVWAFAEIIISVLSNCLLSNFLSPNIISVMNLNVIV